MVTGHKPVAQPPIWRFSAPYLKPPGEGGPAIPPGTGCHFSPLLQPAWAAVGLFFAPVDTQGIVLSLVYNSLDVSISKNVEIKAIFLLKGKFIPCIKTFCVAVKFAMELCLLLML